MVRALGIAGMLLVVAATAAVGQGERVATPALVELGWTGIVGSWTPSGFILDCIRPRSPAARCVSLRIEPGGVTRILTLDGEPLTPESAGLLTARASASLAIATGRAEEDEELVLGPCVLERTRSARRGLLEWPDPSLPPAPRWRAVSGTPAPRHVGTLADPVPVGEALLP